MPANWQDSYNKYLQASQTRGNEKDVIEKSNVLGDIWGAFTNGQKDPFQSYLDNSQGDNAGNIKWQQGDEDVYRQMDARQWKELGNLRQDNQREWIRRRREALKAGATPGVFEDPDTGERGMTADDTAAKATADAQAKKEADFQKWRMDTMQRLDAFSKEMNMPVDQLIAHGDLGVINAGNTGRTDAGNAAYAAGLGGGGVSSMNSQRAVTDAQMKYQMGRQQLGLQATDSLLGQMGNMAHEGEDTRRYEQGMNLQLQAANEQARQMQFGQQQQRQGQLFGMIGGLAGGMYGGPAGASMGYNLGSGLGSYGAGSYKPRPLSYPGGSSMPGSGLGGGYKNPYGGSQ